MVRLTPLRLVMGGTAVLIALNYFIFYQELDGHAAVVGGGGADGLRRHAVEQDMLRMRVAMDQLEMQLERKEMRIRELEQLQAKPGDLPPSSSASSSSSSSSRARPKQVLHVGWEWGDREVRKLRYWDGTEIYVHRTTYEGSMANPLERSVDWWDSVESGIWERDTFVVYKTFLNANSSFIDFGAWIGPTVLFGASLAKHAYALEPDPYAFDELRANLALNPRLQERTWIEWKCIADRPGVFTMSGGGGDSMASLHAKSDKSWKVDCVTLPRFIEEHQIENLDLIKMDAEGVEYLILPSFKPWLLQRKIKPTLWLSVHKWAYDSAGLEALMDVLRLYKRVYEDFSKPLDLDTYELCYFCTLLATDLDVEIYNDESDDLDAIFQRRQ